MEEKKAIHRVEKVKLFGHPVRTGQARRGFPGTQWREDASKGNIVLIMSHKPRL